MGIKKTALVAGLGIAGRAIFEYLGGLRDWDVVGVSRHRPFTQTAARFVSIDLLDSVNVSSKADSVGAINYLFYAAYKAGETPEAEIEPNLAMLKSALDLAERGGVLESVLLVTGTKAYGAHLPHFKTPFKETDPRLPIPNFYYDQEDYLQSQAAESGWRWSGIRPSAICGLSMGSPMNLTAVIGCYAAIQRELSLPFSFPGSIAGAHSLSQATDARLLARAAVWAATNPACANESFNISNGDLYRLENLWPVFAEYFALEPGPPCDMYLAHEMADKEPVWQQIVRKYDLFPSRLGKVAGWPFGDYVFHRASDNVSDLIKCRSFGFNDFVESEAMYLELFSKMQQQRLIPPSGAR